MRCKTAMLGAVVLSSTLMATEICDLQTAAVNSMASSDNDTTISAGDRQNPGFAISV